ncbi:glycine betaine ABC transporter substrate-binding protein [Bacteroides fragilis]|uniref:glycine betaine ABC transporter substrate-binding protein n=1 Tax=Bacteroides fragilis TaxID=817 RepID=UPI000EC3AC51|nr:glycine betaine ABC transporter substrate-binding protein [Bacteroides fragilis]MCS2211698.1 glycine betaine ABC transporter substrate-binding protein [Bacteroides fragilis]MCS2253796.1 glycine betaine ABC transporter substrate-binding protein [Bacteroides fragilis]MCY1130110.1 glycine betaine ABC transporter substrate-binding protein [Bacteroides fragilis]RGJ19415.1 glycine/betaine ABC transporter substrate-binding protein [Bacteroides fragilis]RHM89571.1 glycine/betaine ABC transporter su
MRKYRIIGSLLLLAVMCVACNPDSGKKKISIAYANWLEGIAMSHLAKVVLEEKGYEVELLNADVAPVFASVSRKKADVFMDAWLPVTMKDYIDQYGDQIEFIGEVYDSARVGLVVPQYVTIDSIGELAAHKGKFSSEIVGIDAGAGIMKTTDKAIGDYGLDGYKLLTSSSSTMLASLQKAMEKEAWIVITGWTPHWMFDRYPLKFLHDPKGTYGNVESIYVVGWKGFTEKDPFAAKFFSNIKFTTEEISSLMKALKDARMDEEELVRKWRDEHRELVESWIPES